MRQNYNFKTGLATLVMCVNLALPQFSSAQTSCSSGAIITIGSGGIPSDTWNAGNLPPLAGNAGIKTITIMHDGSLTIDGITLNFIENGNIVVNPGGELTITNSILQSLAGCDPWDGIEVQ